MIKVSKKDVLASYPYVIAIGYCGMQTLLKCKEAKMYNCGTYGWNCYIFHISNSTCIVTGYRPFGDIYPKHDVVKKYESKARKIYTGDGTWKEKSKKLEKLLDKFIKEVIDNA